MPQITAVTLVDLITLPKYREKRYEKKYWGEPGDTAMKFISRRLGQNYKLELILGDLGFF